MGESLFNDFLEAFEARDGDLQDYVLRYGVLGLLESFEHWLREKGYLDYANGAYAKPGK